MPKCFDCEVLKLNLKNAQSALAHAIDERDQLQQDWDTATANTVLVPCWDSEEMELRLTGVEAERDHFRLALDNVSVERDEAEQRFRAVTARCESLVDQRDEWKSRAESAEQLFAAAQAELDALAAEMNRALAEAEMAGHDADALQVERDTFKAAWIAAIDGNSSMEAERDVLAKRWAELREWMDTDREFEGAVGGYAEELHKCRMKLKELEAER